MNWGTPLISAIVRVTHVACIIAAVLKTWIENQDNFAVIARYSWEMK
jgi:hypothetical protein